MKKRLELIVILRKQEKIKHLLNTFCIEQMKQRVSVKPVAYLPHSRTVKYFFNKKLYVPDNDENNGDFKDGSCFYTYYPEK